MTFFDTNQKTDLLLSSKLKCKILPGALQSAHTSTLARTLFFAISA